MSPRQIRAGATEQFTIVTRARAYKLNDVNVGAKSTEKIKRSHKKEKSLDIQHDVEANTKQIARRELSDTNVKFSKSAMKKTSRRIKLAKKVEDKNEGVAHEVGSTYGSNKSNKLLKNRHSDSMFATDYTENNFVQMSRLEDSGWDKTPKRENTVLGIKVSPSMITPKSTPIKLSLTPHRSTKTPGKSPVSSGSPKTHSIISPKLLKSPRKLSLSSSDNLNKFDSSNSTLQKTKTHNLSNTSMSEKNLSTSLVKSKHRKSSVNLKKIISKFSKSPKIVLKSPKSKKSKSSKLKLLSPSRFKKSPLRQSLSYSVLNTSDLNTKKSIKTSPKKTLLEDKNASTIKQLLLKPRLMKTLTDSQIKDILAEPVVLLERLSSKKISTLSYKVLIPTARKIVELNMSAYVGNTQQNPMTKLLKKSASRLSSSSAIQNLSTQGKKKSSVSLKTSTPRREKIPVTKINTTFNTSVISTDDTSPNIRSRYKNQSNTQLSSQTRQNKNMTIRNVLRPFLFNTSDNDLNQTSTVTKHTVTCNVNEDATTPEAEPEDEKNTTYELIEPQTSSLQQMIKKRTATEANLDKEDIKRTCKVHFANLITGDSNRRKSIDKLSRLRSNMLYNNSRQMDTQRSNQNSLMSSSKSKSSTVINRITPKNKIVRRSQSLNNMISNLSSDKIQTTPQTFASVKKQSEKKSSIRKAPNFSRIHEKLFAKSESLIDAKKRLEDRHQAFAASKIPKIDGKKEVKLLPTDTNNGIHNRFGFKLRKAEATHVILKKQTVFSRQKQQQETRMILKGVRTNRRFELQMKSRNINA